MHINAYVHSGRYTAMLYIQACIQAPEAAGHAAPLLARLSGRFPDAATRSWREARNRLIVLTKDLVAQHRASLEQQAATSSASHMPAGLCQALQAHVGCLVAAGSLIPASM